jgi:hypothetical protein
VPRPLTPAEELDIALLLGYPADFRNENPFFYDALQRINSADHLYDKAISFITRANAIKTRIETEATAAAGIHSLDKADVVFFGAGNATFDALNAQLRVVIKELSCFVHVRKLNDITSGDDEFNSVFAGAPSGSGAAPQW